MKSAPCFNVEGFYECRCDICGKTFRPFLRDGTPMAYADAIQWHHVCGDEQPVEVRAAPTFGPGAELKKLLKRIGIVASPNCSCNARARIMDEKGCDWCAENLSTIVGWLKEEHTRQKTMIPFSETAVSLLVRYAIRRARAIAK